MPPSNGPHLVPLLHLVTDWEHLWEAWPCYKQGDGFQNTVEHLINDTPHS